MRASYLKELHILRAELLSAEERLQRIACGESVSAVQEMFIDNFEIYFYDLKESLIEPDLAEAMRISIKQNVRELLKQNFRLRKQLVDSGVDVTALSGFPVELRKPIPEHGEADLSCCSFCALCMRSKDLVEYGTMDTRETFEHGQNPEPITFMETSSQTLHSVMTFESSPYVQIPQVAELMRPRGVCQISKEFFVVCNRNSQIDASTCTDHVIPQWVNTGAQTIAKTSTSVAISCIWPGQNAGSQTSDNGALSQRHVNSGEDILELLDVYLVPFRKVFLHHLDEGSLKPLTSLTARLTSSPKPDTLDGVFSDLGFLDAICAVIEDEDAATHGPNSARSVRTRILRMKTEITDLEGKLALQSHRLSRALRFISTVKSERTDAADQAARTMTKMKFIQNTLRRLRRDLRSRDRKVRILTNSLKREMHRNRRENQGHDMSNEGMQATDESDELVQDWCTLTSRTPAKIHTFSFEPITDKSIEALVTTRVGDQNRCNEILRHRHQLRLGQLHHIKPLVDDI